jgi:hypothetical protein
MSNAAVCNCKNCTKRHLSSLLLCKHAALHSCMHVTVWIGAHHKCSLCTSQQRLAGRLCACCRQPKCSRCKAHTQHTYSAQHKQPLNPHMECRPCNNPCWYAADTQEGMTDPQQQQKQRSSCSCSFYSTSCRPRLNRCMQHPAPDRTPSTPKKQRQGFGTAADELHAAGKQRICGVTCCSGDACCSNSQTARPPA